jgi:putative membrane protein
MQTEQSLNNSIDNAKKHYSSLFFLPSLKKALLYIAFICIVGVSLTAYALFPSVSSIILGITVFAATVLADTAISKAVLKNDPIFVTRRTSAVSFYGWLLWLGFMALGVALGYLFSNWLLWVKLTLLGFGAVITLRTIVLTATSSSTKWRQILSALLQPALCVAAFYVFWESFAGNLTLQFLPFIFLSPIISYTAVYLLLHSIDRLGKTSFGLPAMPLFRAFILNWVTDMNAPLEAHLEEMGENADISISILKFEATKPKAAIIVPLVHPGPFKNIGSSLLPSMLKDGFEKEYGCDACTPLGILGHELDLASQAQNHKILSGVLSSAMFEAKSGLASPYVRATDGNAIASCQIFDDTVLLSFSLAPKTTEDLPQELGCMVAEEAKKFGLTHAVVVNAHNSLDVVVDTEAHLQELKNAASKCLQKAISLKTKPFMVGSASVFPKDFTQKQGMGAGGITAIVVEVEKQKTAYVVIDGNNMVPHLREKILGYLTALGFENSEVFTTDTHAVSALVTGSRGYHPVGEAMDHNLLITIIGDVAKKAEAKLEPSKAGCIEFVVPQVRVIGEERLHAVTTLVDKAIVKAKKVVAPIFGAECLLFILLLLLF